MALQDLTPQLRTRLRRVEKIVGLFVTLATLVLIAGFGYYIYHTAQRKGWFVPKCKYFTYVASAEGLNVGDPVKLMGFSVGQVTIIEAQPPGSYYHVFIGFEIRRPYYGYIWSDSNVKIAAADFLGRRELEVTTGTAGKPTAYETAGHVTEILFQDQRVSVAKAPGGVFIQPLEEPALTERAEKLVSSVEAALPNILALTNQISATLASATTTLTNLSETVSQTQPILTNLTVITANLRDPHGSLGEWAIPPNLNTQLVLTVMSLDASLQNLAAITSNLNTQVQTNNQVLSQANRLIVDTDNLVQGLKKHWLLRGIFQKMNSNTNAPTQKTGSSK